MELSQFGGTRYDGQRSESTPAHDEFYSSYIHSTEFLIDTKTHLRNSVHDYETEIESSGKPHDH